MSNVDIIQKSFERSIRNRMEKLGTYRRVFDTLISVLSSMLIQKQVLEAKRSDSVAYTEVMSTLQDDIQAYCDQLQLDRTDINDIIAENEGRISLTFSR